MSRARGLPRPGRRAAAALTVALLTAGASGCASEQVDGAGNADTPISVVHTDAELDRAVAAVVERHLKNKGYAVEPSEPVATPWKHTDEQTVAVVDTLAFALQADAEGVLPAPPEPTATESEPADADENPGDSRSPEPSSSGATSSQAAPTTLPSGDSALSADRVDALVEERLAALGGSGDGSGSASPEAAHEAPVTVLAPSKGTTRLRALVTATTAARLDLESVQDLNQRCEEFTAAARVDVNSTARPEATALLRERLDRLAGCRPEAWRPAQTSVSEDVADDRAQIGLTYGVDPGIEHHALVPLEDTGRVLPEGRVSVLGRGDEVPDAVERDLRHIMGRLDADGLRDLQSLVSGPDALSPEEAAQYWLVSRDEEQAPEDWYVPQRGWF